MGMSLIDNESTESCADKYKITDAALAHPEIKEGDDYWSFDHDAINYQYIGCMQQVAEEKKSSSNDLLLPLLMSGMFNQPGMSPTAINNNQMDPMMFLILQKFSGNGNKWSKNIMPFLLAGNGNMDPSLMLLLLEETACELKFHIPDFYYDQDGAAKVVIVKDK